MKRENTIKTELQWCLEKQDRNQASSRGQHWNSFSVWLNESLDHFRYSKYLNSWNLRLVRKWSLAEQKEYLNRGHKTFVVKKMRKWENWLVNQAFFILCSSVSLKISKRPFFQAIHALCVPNLAATWRTHKHFYPNASLGIIFDGFEAFVGNSRFFA